MSKRPSYVVRQTTLIFSNGRKPIDDPFWMRDEWSAADATTVDHFHPASTSHRPITKTRLFYSTTGLIVRFDVEDRFVVARAKSNQESVCEDSCVEFFVRPPNAPGYFNFEVNCCGKILASYIRDWTRTDNGFVDCRMLTTSELAAIPIAYTMPTEVKQEIESAIDWSVAFEIPFSILKAYVGEFEISTSSAWTCNFYKCADKCSHPHWASWAPIGQDLNFHQPDRFGEMVIGRRGN